MKTRILSIILAIVLCLGVLPTAVFASATESTQPDASKWTVWENNYQSNTRIDWPNFSTYLLGEQAAGTTVTVSADMRVGKQGDESTNAGGDAGFLFGIKDLNGDGVIGENDDRYYLVEFSGQMDANRVNVVISRNDKAWGPVRTVRYYCPNYASLNLTATYDSSTATLNAYVNGELITSYTDPAPFDGTGYGLASKITDGIFRNVETFVGTPDFIGLPDGAVFALEDDIYGSIVIPEGKTLTLDLNGHYVFAPVVNYGTLTLTNGKNDGFVEVRRGVSSERNETAAAIDNFGTLTIDGATVFGVTTGGSATGSAIYNRKGATLTVKSGELRAICEKENTCHGIINEGTIDQISGGKIIAEMVYRVNYNASAGILNNGGTIGTISGGEIFARSNGRASSDDHYVVGIKNTAAGTIGTISGGYIHAEAFGNGEVRPFGIYVDGDARIETISGGIIEGYTAATSFAFGIKTSNGTIGTISGGLIRSYMDLGCGGNSIAVATFNNGGVESITGGVFFADGANSGRMAIRCNNDSKITSITGGAFKADTALQNSGATAGVAAGYALSDAQDSGFRYVTNGDITENATADGIIGTTGGKTYELYAYSDKASVNGTVYDGAAAAIEAAADGDTVKLLGNSSAAITVPSGKNITVDINGTTQHGKLTNNGTLVLTDGKQGGRILCVFNESSTVDAIDNYGTLTVDGATVRAFGKGENPEPIAIRNRADAHLSILAGKVMSTMSGQKYGNAVMNLGTIDLIAGGEIAAEITVPYDKDPTGNNVAINMSGASAKIGEISGGYLFARCNNNAGNTQYATVIRINNASQVVEKISGGALRAYSLKKGSVQRVAFGILNESGTIKEISGGFIAGYTTATDFCFGIKNQNKIEKISGGYILAEKDTTEGGGNIIALANWGNVDEISGGTFYSRIYNTGSNTYALRTNNSGKSAYITGGTFGATKDAGGMIRAESSGVNTFKDGCYLGGADEYCRRVIKDSNDSERVVYALGSSVTYGSNTRGRSFVDIIDNNDNNTAVIKEAVSGTTLVNNDSGSYVARLMNGFKNLKAPDLLLVQLSTNDASQNKTLGTLDPDQWDGFDDQTVIGAIETIIKYARDTWGCAVAFYTNPKYESDAYKAMYDALVEIDKKWDIDFIDFYGSEIDNLKSFMTDAIHPNISGYALMAEWIEDYIDYLLPLTPTFTSAAVVLTGQIGLSFLVQFPKSYDLDGCKVNFKVGDQEELRFDEIDLENYKTHNMQKYYKFTCWESSIEMADTVTASVRFGDETYSVDYSVSRYIDYFMSNADKFSAEAVDLVRALGDYGYYAQRFLAESNGWEIGTDYAEVTEKFTAEYDCDAIKAAVEDKAFAKDISGASIADVSYSLNLSSETSINVYIKPESGVPVTASAIFNGKDYEAELQPDGRYLVKITGIPATLLGETITVTGDADGAFSISVSALSYVRSVLNNDSFSENAKNAVSALYNYYIAAAAYKAANA